MPSTTRWWWVRHAPVPGAPARLYGQMDAPCDTGDGASFAALARLLPAGAVRILTPLRRTRLTLAAIDAAADESGGTAEPPLVEPMFAEQHFGVWQGLTWAEMEASDPAAYRDFWADPTGNAPPGGESFAAVMARTAAAVARLSREFAGRDIIAVAHGGSIRAAVGLALGLDARTAMAIVVDNLSLTRLAFLADAGGGAGAGPGAAGGGRGGGAAGGAWRVETVNAPCRWHASRWIRRPGS